MFTIGKFSDPDDCIGWHCLPIIQTLGSPPVVEVTVADGCELRSDRPERLIELAEVLLRAATALRREYVEKVA